MSFELIKQQYPSLSFSEQLRLYSEDEWHKIIQHRFVDELGDGTLDNKVLANYLVQDYAFVDALIRLVCTAIADAPDMAVRNVLANFLSAVTSDENTYFVRSFEALGVKPEVYLNPQLNPVADAFEKALLNASQKGYRYAMTTLLVAEWSYRTWAMRLKDKNPEHFYHKEWITLHDNPEFNQFVDWIRTQVDRLDTLPITQQAELAENFRYLCSLENQFFSAAYQL